MEKLVGKGTRYIGISNFNPAQLDDLLKSTTIKPKAHQFELHPYLPQQDYVEANFKMGIESVIAYAPLGNTNPVYSTGRYGTTGKDNTAILSHPVITGIAKERSCTAAQVVLAWNLNRNVVVIPKAAQLGHQKENLATLEKCKLQNVDLEKIRGIKERVRLNALPCQGLAFKCFDGMEGAPFCAKCT